MQHLLGFSGIRQLFHALKTGLFTFILVSTLSAQIIQPELVGSWQEGPCYSLSVESHYAYANSGSYLKVFDVEDPAVSPLVSSFLSRGFIHHINVMQDLAFLAIYDKGLQVVDVSDKSNPVELAFLPLEGTYPVLLVNEQYIYYAIEEIVYIIDVIDPSHPVITEQIESEQLRFRKLYARDGKIIGTGGTDGVRIYDVVENGNLVEVCNLKRSGLYVYDAAVVGDNCYIAGSDSIIVYDISDPEVPVWKGSQRVNKAGFLQERQNMLFVSPYTGTEISVFELSDPLNPNIIHQTATSIEGYLEELIITDDKLFMVSSYGSLLQASYDELQVSDINIKKFGHSYAYDIDVYQDIVFLAQTGYGCGIFNASDPSNPLYIGDFGANLLGNYFTIEGNYIYSLYGGLSIVDISIPAIPVITSHTQFSGSLRDIVVRGEFAYIADYSNGLVIFDVSDPYSPLKLSGTEPENGDIVSVEIEGDYAYCAARFGGLIVYDISDPANPFITGQVTEIGNISYVKKIGNYAYVYPYYGSGLLFDISDPSNPQELDVPIGFSVKEIHTAQGFAFCISITEGLSIYDVTNPGNPIYLSGYDIPGDPYAAVLYENRLYVADSYCGLFIISYPPLVGTDEMTEPDETLCTVFPNPFSKEINIHLELIKQSDVTLEFLDSNGKLIKRIYDAQLPPGQYDFVPAINYDSNGIKIIRSIIDGKVETKKILRIK
jgi:hypothetical protein